MRAALVPTLAISILIAGCGTTYPELAEPGYLRKASPKSVADDLFAKAIALDPNAIGPYFVAGEAYLRAGYVPEGLKHMERVLALAPTNGYKLADIAGVLIETGDARSAVRFWDTARSVAGDKARTWSAVAWAWARVGNEARARAMFEKVVTLPGGWAMSDARKQWKMGIAWLEAGRPELAGPLLETAMRLRAPEDGLMLITIGAAYLKSGDRARGEELMRKGFAIEKTKNLIRANRDIGVAYASVGDFASAEGFVNRALTASPTNATSLLAFGAAYIDGGDPGAGEKYLTRALAEGTGDWEIIATVGAAWLKLERSGSARSESVPPAPPPASTDEAAADAL